MTGDRCPLCTEGLRALVALLDSATSGSGDPGRTWPALIQLQAEQRLIGERLEAAFGAPVKMEIRSLGLEVME